MSNLQPVPEHMRAAHFAGDGKIIIKDKPVSTPGIGEVLVKVHACALCGSDRGVWENGSEVTPGHEGSGTVVAVGPGVTTPIGTRAAIYLVAYCGQCRMCHRGETGACLQKERMIGFSHDGAYAEYVVVPERCLLPIDPSMDLDLANMLLDVLGTTFHAMRRGQRQVGSIKSACVMGCGPVGLGAIAALKATGVEQIMAVDLAPYRLELADQSGATVIDARSADPVAEVRRLLPEGPDVVIEASGHSVAQRQALDMVAADGCVLIVGHSHHQLEIQTSRDLIVQEKALIGCEYFAVGEFADNLALVREGKCNPLPLITHRYPLERIQEAFEVFWAGQTGKVMVYP